MAFFSLLEQMILDYTAYIKSKVSEKDQSLEAQVLSNLKSQGKMDIRQGGSETVKSLEAQIASAQEVIDLSSVESDQLLSQEALLSLARIECRTLNEKVRFEHTSQHFDSPSRQEEDATSNDTDSDATQAQPFDVMARFQALLQDERQALEQMPSEDERKRTASVSSTSSEDRPNPASRAAALQYLIKAFNDFITESEIKKDDIQLIEQFASASIDSALKEVHQKKERLKTDIGKQADILRIAQIKKRLADSDASPERREDCWLIGVKSRYTDFLIADYDKALEIIEGVTEVSQDKPTWVKALIALRVRYQLKNLKDSFSQEEGAISPEAYEAPLERALQEVEKLQNAAFRKGLEGAPGQLIRHKREHIDMLETYQQWVAYARRDKALNLRSFTPKSQILKPLSTQSSTAAENVFRIFTAHLLEHYLSKNIIGEAKERGTVLEKAKRLVEGGYSTLQWGVCKAFGSEPPSSQTARVTSSKKCKHVIHCLYKLKAELCENNAWKTELKESDWRSLFTLFNAFLEGEAQARDDSVSIVRGVFSWFGHQQRLVLDLKRACADVINEKDYTNCPERIEGIKFNDFKLSEDDQVPPLSRLQPQ